MVSKRFKGKTCVYCAEEGASATGDHVFARNFFPIGKRDGLPIVPSCEACNRSKSEVEHYLTALLPFGGRHPDSPTMLVEDVPRRLAKNQKLHRELAAGQSTVAVSEDGALRDGMAVPFDATKVVELFAYVAKGLAAHHWDVVIPADYKVESVLLNPAYEATFQNLFLRSARQRIDGNIGDGAFLYQGAQASDDPALTMWRFRAFGGLVMAGDEHLPEPAAHAPWVLTGRNIPPLKEW